MTQSKYDKFLIFYKATISKPSEIDRERKRVEVLLYEHCLDEVDYNPRMAALDELERQLLDTEKVVRWINPGQVV